MTQKLFNPVIYLIGFPASGKYTTAKAIVSAQQAKITRAGVA